MDIAKQLQYFNKLKEVERYGYVGDRHETSAEHTFSTLTLASYFLKKVKGLDESKVFKLILYHDIVEIEAGDNPFWLDGSKEEQKKKEEEGFQKVKERIPPELVQEYEECWREFEAWETPEAKFATAMDKIDPTINALSNKERWHTLKLTEKKYRSRKEKYFEPFPELHEFFNDLMEYVSKKGFFVEE